MEGWFLSVMTLQFRHILSLNFTTACTIGICITTSPVMKQAQTGGVNSLKVPLKVKDWNLMQSQCCYCPVSCCRNAKTSFSKLMWFCFLSWLKLNRYVLIIVTREARNYKFLKLHQPTRSISNTQRGRDLETYEMLTPSEFPELWVKRQPTQIHWQTARDAACLRSAGFSQLCASGWCKPCKIPSEYHYSETWEDHRKVQVARSQAKFGDTTEHIAHSEMWGFYI